MDQVTAWLDAWVAGVIREAPAPSALQAAMSSLSRARCELALAGLDGSGKTTLAHAIGGAKPTTIQGQHAPTIGVVVQNVRCSGVALALWDLGGQQRFRFDWARHVHGCGALLFAVDLADQTRLPEARQALHQLLEAPALREIPLLVLANKTDLLAAEARERYAANGWALLIQELQLDHAPCRTWSVLGVSALRQQNLAKLMRWIVLRAHGCT